MTYKLFLDDIRFPVENDYIIARNYDDAVWYVENKGIPYFISFDHDLADPHYIIGGENSEKTGYSFAKWFADYVLVNDLDLPENFAYHVHSMNPVGAENIRKYMEDFFRAYREQT